VILLFGTGRLSRIGNDLGSAIRGFRAAMKDEAAEPHARDQSMDAEHPAKR
jgi:TatA/E family protein of Tat protein translocase